MKCMMVHIAWLVTLSCTEYNSCISSCLHCTYTDSCIGFSGSNSLFSNCWILWETFGLFRFIAEVYAFVGSSLRPSSLAILFLLYKGAPMGLFCNELNVTAQNILNFLLDQKQSGLIYECWGVRLVLYILNFLWTFLHSVSGMHTENAFEQLSLTEDLKNYRDNNIFELNW